MVLVYGCCVVSRFEFLVKGGGKMGNPTALCGRGYKDALFVTWHDSVTVHETIERRDDGDRLSVDKNTAIDHLP
jgi:hypothetical protein